MTINYMCVGKVTSCFVSNDVRVSLNVNNED